MLWSEEGTHQRPRDDGRCAEPTEEVRRELFRTFRWQAGTEVETLAEEPAGEAGREAAGAEPS